MNGKDILENPGRKEDEILISEILEAIFRHKDIKFESVRLIHWKVTEDNVVGLQITTLGDFISVSGDGHYHFAITNALILGIEKEPIEVPDIDIEVSFENGKWSDPRVYTDYESCSPESSTPEALWVRNGEIKETLKGVLELLALILRIINSVCNLSD